MKKDNSSVLDWLCGEDNPPVRYLTRKNLLDIPDSKLIADRKKLNSYPVIKGILKHHKTFWGDDIHHYRKYTGGYWSLIFLGDLNADGNDKLIRNGIEFEFADKRWQSRINSGSMGVVCLVANITRAMANLGYDKDERVIDLTEKIAQAMVDNNGIECFVMDYSMMPQCHMALPKVLMALATYTGRKAIVKKAIILTAEKLLERDIYRYVPTSVDKWQAIYKKYSAQAKAAKAKSKSATTLKDLLAEPKRKLYAQNKGFKAKEGWLKFGHPMHYNSNILEAMRSLTDAGVPHDKRMDDALDVIEKNRAADGTWIMGYSLNGKMWIDIEKRGKPSKWITYHALRVLNFYNRIEL